MAKVKEFISTDLPEAAEISDEEESRKTFHGKKKSNTVNTSVVKCPKRESRVQLFGHDQILIFEKSQQ